MLTRLLSKRLPLVVSCGVAAWIALAGHAVAGQADQPPPPQQYHSVQASGWAMPLEVPRGFAVDEVATGLISPRFMALDADGSLVVAEHTEGKVIRLRDSRRSGHYDVQQEVAHDLTYVHSVAFMDGQLYAAAEDRVVALSDFGADGRAGIVQTIVENLPAGARDLYGHRTRTLLPGPDHKLYLSIGSACDVCEDDNPLRAVIARMNADGSELEVFATGLRNSVGIAFRPQAPQPELWGADMGRNNISPSVPPDELNLIQQGLDYGWPYCMGDAQPDPELGDPDRCATTELPRFKFAPHWAPLGLIFYTGSSFPSDYRGDALIAFHGSAPDQTPRSADGYRVSRIHFADGQPAWMQDLLRGFTIGDGHWGRPVGLVVAPDGSVLVSDDWGGKIFRISYTG
jgi:glucose/arabinose dehydrogenase